MSRVTVLLLATIFCFYLPAASWSEPSGEKAESGISQGEKKWAVQWLNTRLPLLMEKGLIKRIKTPAKGESYEVFVASSWHNLTLEEKTTFLKDFSRARQLTYHSPCLVIRGHDDSQRVAEVNREGIFLVGGEDETFFPRDSW